MSTSDIRFYDGNITLCPSTGHKYAVSLQWSGLLILLVYLVTIGSQFAASGLISSYIDVNYKSPALQKARTSEAGFQAIFRPRNGTSKRTYASAVSVHWLQCCGNIGYFLLVSEESFWLCAYSNRLAKVVFVWNLLWWDCAYSALESFLQAFVWESIWNSLFCHWKNTRVRLHQLARPIVAVSS